MPERHALVFNSDFEDELAGVRRPVPPGARSSFLAKLASRFLFLGGGVDTLLADFELPGSFRRSFAGAGIELPRVAPSPSRGEPHELLPWGAAPSMRARARELGLAYDPPPDAAVRRANAKTFAHEVAKRLGLDPPGLVISSRDEVEARLAERFRGGELWVVKRAFGFAGRGHLLGRGPSLPPNGAGWLASAFARGDQVVLEPWVERERDLSAHLSISRTGEVRFAGAVEMICARNGGYRGNRIGALDLPPSLGSELERVARAVGSELAREGYFGPAGIDAFVSEGRLRPLVEINARHSMGRIALSLARLVPEGGVGSWLVLPRRPAEQEATIVTDPFPDEPGDTTALVLARDREELLARERALQDGRDPAPG